MNEGASGAAPRRPNLLLRVATAAVGLPVLGGLAWVGETPFAVAIGVVAFLASVEFVHGWLLPSMPIRDAFRQWMTPAACALMAAGAHWRTNFVVLGIAVAALFAAAGYSHSNLLGPRRPLRVQAWCMVYIGALLSTAVLVRDGWHGREWLFVGILATFAVDTGAYTVGKLVGRHKMAPAISPGKTWEGAAGGYACGIGAVLGLDALFDTGASTVTVLPFALLLPLVSQGGDLLESWMKRRMGVKDASGLLPGHGGLLDRLDSLMPATAFLWLFLETRVW